MKRYCDCYYDPEHHQTCPCEQNIKDTLRDKVEEQRNVIKVLRDALKMWENCSNYDRAREKAIALADDIIGKE